MFLLGRLLEEAAPPAEPLSYSLCKFVVDEVALGVAEAPNGFICAPVAALVAVLRLSACSSIFSAGLFATRPAVCFEASSAGLTTTVISRC